MKASDFNNGICEACNKESFVMALSRIDQRQVCMACSMMLEGERTRQLLKAIDITNKQKRKNEKAYLKYLTE